MKKIILLQVLFVGFFSWSVTAQDFTYESTKTESVSKWQRLNTVEKYLETIQGKMDSVQKKLKTSDQDLEKSLKGEIEALDKKTKTLEAQVKKLLDGGEKDKKEDKALEELKKQVTEQGEAIETLKKQFNSLDSVLKSLNEFLKAGSAAQKKPGP